MWIELDFHLAIIVKFQLSYSYLLINFIILKLHVSKLRNYIKFSNDILYFFRESVRLSVIIQFYTVVKCSIYWQIAFSRRFADSDFLVVSLRYEMNPSFFKSTVSTCKIEEYVWVFRKKKSPKGMVLGVCHSFGVG